MMEGQGSRTLKYNGNKKQAGNFQTRRRKICLHTYKYAYYVHAEKRHGVHVEWVWGGGAC